MNYVKIITAIFIVLAVVLILSIAAFWRSANAPTSGAPDALTAIRNADGYLTRIQKALRMDVALFSQFHRRKFGVPAFPFHMMHKFRELAVYMRIVDAEALVTTEEIEELTSPIDRLLAAALHCDYLPLPDAYLENLGTATRAGGYALTHAVMATKWAVENGGLKPDQLADLTRLQTKLLIDLIEQETSNNDLRIEAIAFLYYSGNGQHVREEWVRQVVATQNPDGGWSQTTASKGKSHQHTTQLGLWLLLEHQFPGIEEPIVPPRRGRDSPRPGAKYHETQETATCQVGSPARLGAL